MKMCLIPGTSLSRPLLQFNFCRFNSRSGHYSLSNFVLYYFFLSLSISALFIYLLNVKLRLFVFLTSQIKFLQCSYADKPCGYVSKASIQILAL